MPRRLQIHVASLLCVAFASAPAAADTLKLANGDVLNGEIVEWAVDHVVIEHPQLGQVRLSLDKLEVDTGTPPSPGLFGTRFLRGWKRNIDFGWNGRQGNENTKNITAGLNFQYADEFRRWMVTGRYYLNQKDDDDDDDNNARLDLRRDWLFPGHDWFVFASLRYQFDQFEAWKHRTVLSLGPGYNLLHGESHDLDLRMAPTFTKEYAGLRSEKAEWLVGIDYRWTISKRSSLHFSNDFYVEGKPNAGDFRNLTLSEWTLAIAERPALNLKLGGSNEYDSSPDSEDQPNDLRYYLAIGLDF
jgi:putative salt-induced outer membrane protein YdiY